MWGKRFEERSGNVHQHAVVNSVCICFSICALVCACRVYYCKQTAAFLYMRGLQVPVSLRKDNASWRYSTREPAYVSWRIYDRQERQSISVTSEKCSDVGRWTVYNKVGPLSGSVWPARCFEQNRKKKKFNNLKWVWKVGYGSMFLFYFEVPLSDILNRKSIS